jgi:hypothetical protein
MRASCVLGSTPRPRPSNTSPTYGVSGWRLAMTKATVEWLCYANGREEMAGE